MTTFAFPYVCGETSSLYNLGWYLCDIRQNILKEFEAKQNNSQKNTNHSSYFFLCSVKTIQV